MPSISLHGTDAAELAEVLQFLSQWLATGQQELARSLGRFVGHRAYDVSELRADLERSTFLLGGTDGGPLVGGQQQ